MTQEEYIYALKKIRNSILFILIHINIGTIDILPDWIGYILLYQSIMIIGKEEKSALLLTKLVLSLIIFYLIDWLCVILGINFNIKILVEIMVIIRIYVNFQVITHIIDISIKHKSEMTDKIRNVRNVMTILLTFLSLTSYLVNVEILAVISYVALFIYFILFIRQILVLNAYIKVEQNKI